MSQLFETIKCKNGKLFNLEEHSFRFNKARKECFGVSDKISLSNIIEIPEHCKTGLFRCRVVYAETIEKIEFVPHQFRQIKSLKLVETNKIGYNFKYSNREKLQGLFEQRGNCDDIIILKNNFVTDSSTANLVFYDGQKWWTPDTPLLQGTQRAKLIRSNKIFVCKITKDKISDFKKVGLINAMWDFEDMPEIETEYIYS